MRVALRSDSAAISRTLSDLLRVLQYEVVASASEQMPQIVVESGSLTLLAPDGSPVELPRPVALQKLARQLQQLQHHAKGAPLKLAAGWRLEPLARMLHHEAGQHVPLTEKESLLLSALRHAHPHAAARDALLKDIWAYEGDIETHTLETHIYRLRGKLAALVPPPADIITHDGTYRLAIEA